MLSSSSVICGGEPQNQVLLKNVFSIGNTFTNKPEQTGDVSILPKTYPSAPSGRLQPMGSRRSPTGTTTVQPEPLPNDAFHSLAVTGPKSEIRVTRKSNIHRGKRLVLSNCLTDLTGLYNVERCLYKVICFFFSGHPHLQMMFSFKCPFRRFSDCHVWSPEGKWSRYTCSWPEASGWIGARKPLPVPLPAGFHVEHGRTTCHHYQPLTDWAVRHAWTFPLHLVACFPKPPGTAPE